MEGRLIGVGVGPGDPELLTLAAVRVIRESDCILLPNEKKEECYAYKIVRQVVPEIEEKEICPMQFPMTKDADVLRAAQDRCFAEVQARMRQGKTLVFLTIGDPSVYSTYHYIHRRVLATGMPASMITACLLSVRWRQDLESPLRIRARRSILFRAAMRWRIRRITRGHESI